MKKDKLNDMTREKGDFAGQHQHREIESPPQFNVFLYRGLKKWNCFISLLETQLCRKKMEKNG